MEESTVNDMKPWQVVQKDLPRNFKFSFLKLPTEIRLMIFSILFQSMDPLGATIAGMWEIDGRGIEDQYRAARDRCKLSAQVLRTCRQVYCEGYPVLYGDNTWYFELGHDTPCLPSVFASHFPDWMPRPASDDAPLSNCLPHIRRIKVMLVNPLLYVNQDKVRNQLRYLAERLRQFPNVQHLEFHCAFVHSYRRNGETRVNFEDWNAWTNSSESTPESVLKHLETSCHAPLVRRGQCPEKEKEKELAGILKTWLGRLRNIKSVSISGIPPRCADIIKQRCEGSAPLDVLPDRYEALENQVAGDRSCMKNLRRALLACEAEEKGAFEDAKDAVMRNVILDEWFGEVDYLSQVAGAPDEF
ncbi:hypothetical protein B0T16DRAFT_458869 [Cercophora newfieldiana]|uniref:Uncharacterized protein n=1 Tax=Cercophora newfieldiana TaxID=92897 RepID=A0AA40CQJ2_9PEZI|nr:hypothetical protein B0T16DRAFT_458869 [Cercophora newfieldiana]